MEVNIEQLEHRYQSLFGDFQTGKINEAMFTSEVDKIQFRDDWGRYWMLGAQSGAWHYYDGQAWHQANPYDADKLPFLDDQGRYWQRGAKSGDWYYSQAETDEWVKPGESDPSGPLPVQTPLPGQAGQWQAPPTFADAYAQPQAAQTEGTPPNQFEAQLFQDDEGRYWTVGAKTGQWYFYDEQGWHPAHEFQSGVAPQAQQPPPYQPQPQPQPSAYTPYSQQAQTPYQTPQTSGIAQGYASQPYQPQPDAAPATHPVQTYPAQSQQPAERQQPSPAPQPQPAQAYMPPAEPQPAQSQQPVERQPAVAASQSQPVQGYASAPAPAPQAVREQPGPAYSAQSQPQPAPAESPVDATPSPPQGTSQSGTWYYFDGNQWLKYSSGEPADETPPDPRMILDQEPDSSKVKAGPKSEPVVAEFFEDDEPPIEVVDVEVITVIEAEPDIEPEPYVPPTPEVSREPVAPVSPTTDEVRPRRTKPLVDTPAPAPIPPEPQRQPKKRTPSDPGRPVTPRKKATAHEPTIIIPTGSTASGISAPSSTRAGRSPKPRTMSEQRRAREDTVPIEPVPLPGPEARPKHSRPRHQKITQSMPKIARSPGDRSDVNQAGVAKRARQVTEEISTSVPESQPIQQEQPQKEGYTFGAILRSFPSTFWTGLAGLIVLLIVGGLIIVGTTMFSLSDSPLDVGGVAAVQSPTPTLDAALPDSTPTLGPTPTTSAETIDTPTPVSVTGFSSAGLDFTLEYPENWLTSEDTSQVIFSSSEEGLLPDELKDVSFRVGMSDDESPSISDLLTSVLAKFTPEAEILNEGTISIASQTWTSTLIQFEDENLGGQGYATLAVTNKDGVGYFLIAVAQAAEWNSVQPMFQEIINSFRFGQSEVVVQATPNPTPQPTTDSSTTEPQPTVSDEQLTATPTPTLAPQPAALPGAAATPLVYLVQSGDTLIGIAIKFGVDVDLLASENGITDPETLKVDQELTIPFTAEELKAFNESGGAAAITSSDSSDEAASGETDSTETASTETAATSEESPSSEESPPAEEPPPAADGPPVSGKIVYPAFNPDINSYDLWMVNAATGEQTLIVGNASQPAFNKDGSLLAYRSWELSTRGIFFRDFVGGRNGKVTNFGEDGLPTWSPDGFTFAFASRKEGDRVPRIYIGNQNGGDPFGLAFQGEYPSTFPDGKLAVKGCTPSGDCGIFAMGAAGGAEKKISGEAADTAPAPSRDGSRIAFMSLGRGGNNWEIWVMGADGSNPQRLTENGNNDGLPAWSPDGQSIAYVSDQGGVWAIWVMNADGSGQRKLVDMNGSPDGKVLHDEFNSRGWLEERISWAP